GTLYIAPPLGRTTKSLRSLLRRIGIPFTEPYSSILVLNVAGEDLHRLSGELENWMSRAEMQASKALIVPGGVVPTIDQFFQMQSLSALLARVSSKWLVDMLHEGRLLAHFQPIVSAN